MNPPDVLIVGGGLLGAGCARSFACRGVSTMLLDSGTEGGIASTAAAGMLAPLAESGPEDPLLGLGVRARDLYHELAPVLAEETGIDIGLWSDGILQLAFTDEEAHQLRSDIAWQRQRGFKSDWLSPEGLHDECPWVSPQALGALHAPEDGALTASALLQALLASAEKHGARLVHDQRVEALDIQQGKVTGVRTSTETYSAGAVVLAAGCWSGRIGGLPRPLSVEPVRGQMAAFAWPADAKPGIAYAGSHYVLKVGDEAFAGSTMEHAGFDASVTEEGLASVVGQARRISPTLQDEVPARTWAGLRPVTPDGRPIVGRDPDAEDLWYATGHGRNGILWAGLTGELIARLLTGEGVDHDLTPIDPARFWKSFQAHAPPEDPAEGDSGGNQPNG